MPASEDTIIWNCPECCDCDYKLYKYKVKYTEIEYDVYYPYTMHETVYDNLGGYYSRTVYRVGDHAGLAPTEGNTDCEDHNFEIVALDGFECFESEAELEATCRELQCCLLA